MFKRSKPLLVILVILILVTLGMVLPYNRETYQGIEEITARAGSQIVGGSIEGANVSHQYFFCPGTYCGKHGAPIARTINGSKVPDKGGDGRKQESTYELVKTSAMAQSIAYALQVQPSAGPEDIQNLIWASDQWLQYTGGSCLAAGSLTTGPYKTTDPGIYGRSTKFANFVYKALNPLTGELGLVNSIGSGDDKNVKIMVDQDEDTYTLGPYTISFSAMNATPPNNQVDPPSNGKLEDLIWDEIVHNYSGKFIWSDIYAMITFQGEPEENATRAEIEVLDANGEVIKEHFPHFGQEFYLRYKSNKDGKIPDIIEPKIEVSYLKKINNVFCDLYGLLKVRYSMASDEADLFLNALKSLGGGSRSNCSS